MDEQTALRSTDVNAGVAPATDLPVPTTPSSRNGNFFSPINANIIAAVSSLIAGGLTGWRLISERFHTNMTSMRLGEDIKEERREFGAHLQAKISADHVSKADAYTEVQKAIHRYEDQFDNRFSFAETLSKKWGLLRNHQKAEVAFSVAAALGIVFGSMLLISNDLFSQKEREELAKKGKEGDRNAPDEHAQQR
jgi:hypothetical protein